MNKQLPYYGLIGFRMLLNGLVDLERQAYTKHGLCEGSRSSLVTYHISKWKAWDRPLDHLDLSLLFMVDMEPCGRDSMRDSTLVLILLRALVFSRWPRVHSSLTQFPLR
jgi:hypothetical protein